MDYVYAVFTLLSGLGAFLVGVKLLSDNTEKLSTNKIKNLFNKTSKSKLVGVGIGTVSTAIIQSSGLTTVMVVGFVNAGVMTLGQATTIIMGANIGTTITGQIAALQSFSFAVIAAGFAGVGVFMAMFSKKERLTMISYAIAGLGLIFVGLILMSNAMSSFQESEAVVRALSGISNPFLLFLIGIVLTALVQSSSATTSVIISMGAAGMVFGTGGNEVFYIILGTNIGSCVTALMSSIGANNNAKRAAIIHLLFNFIGSIIFFIFLICFKDFASLTFQKWFPGYASTQIAMFHTFFNVICTLIFLPFSNLFVKMSQFIIRDKKTDTAEKETTLMDKRFLSSPAIAVDKSKQELMFALKMSVHSLRKAVDAFNLMDEAPTEDIKNDNKRTYAKLMEIENYLIKVSTYDTGFDMENQITALHASVGNVHRICELSENITKYTRRSVLDNLHFSPAVKEEIDAMMTIIEKMADETERVFGTEDVNLLADIDSIENEIDQKRKDLIKDHINRLSSGECKAENSGVFINLVCNLERAGDHLTYMAHYVETL